MVDNASSDEPVGMKLQLDDWSQKRTYRFGGLQGPYVERWLAMTLKSDSAHKIAIASCEHDRNY